MVMKKRHLFQLISVLFVMATLFLPAISSGTEVNVALGKSVTHIGTGTMYGDISTLVDGAFLPRGTDWDDGTVYFHELGEYVEINLGSIYEIKSFIAQADNNDTYRISYHDLSDNSWKVAWSIPQYNDNGMQTRPNPADNSEKYVLPAPITTDILHFYATWGDGKYSFSEIQAYSTVVPVPPAILLFAPGLLGLAGLKRKYLG
jgi:hypothetical protein